MEGNLQLNIEMYEESLWMKPPEMYTILGVCFGDLDTFSRFAVGEVIFHMENNFW